MLPVVKPETRTALLKSFDAAHKEGKSFFTEELKKLQTENPEISLLIGENFYKLEKKYGQNLGWIIFQESGVLASVIYSLLDRQAEADEMDKAWGDTVDN